jgi:two-component system chemotaxis response regulator CheY
LKALIVDDSRAMRMILRRLLKSLGFETVEAEDGQVALTAVQEQGPFDIALVDWNMPVMNGLEFILAVRANHDLDAMRIMMVTTETEPTQLVLALEAGASEYLMKPFSSEAVVEKLEILGIRGAA